MEHLGTDHVNPFGENFRFFKFYPSNSHKKVVHRITRGLEGNCGLALLTGEIGIGKTSVCRHIIQSSSGEFVFAESGNPFLKPAEQLYIFCQQFGVDVAEDYSIRDLTDALTAFFMQKAEEGIKPVIVIDECHLLAAEHFSLLLVLYNLRIGAMPLVQMVLIGQVEIMARLKEPGLEALNQRIGVRCELAPMNKEETKKYIQFKLHNAEFPDLDVFTPATLNRLWQVTGGLPRLINHACSHALDSIAFTGESTVSPQLIDQVAADPMYQGLFTIRTIKESSRYRLKIAAIAASVCLVGAVGYFLLRPSTPVVVTAPHPVTQEFADASQESVAAPLIASNVPSEVVPSTSKQQMQGVQAPQQVPVTPQRSAAGNVRTKSVIQSSNSPTRKDGVDAEGLAESVSSSRQTNATVVQAASVVESQPSSVGTAPREDVPAVAQRGNTRFGGTVVEFASAAKNKGIAKTATPVKKVTNGLSQKPKDEMAALLADALDESMHPALARLQVSAVAWSEVEAERIAVLNNRIVHEGDSLGAFVLERIGRDYLLFIVDGTRYKKKWT
ncbi:MAG: AAA family ATPase [Desulfovibrionales bacterium]|nr:AAA family ATPase [Desulfovibrionales bacterium]